MGSTTALAIALLLFCSNKVFAQSTQQNILFAQDKKDSKIEKNDPEEQEKPLDFSDTGRPGQHTAGDSRGNCSNLDGQVKAVVPTSHTGKTISSHPSFWVYFPYSSQRISYVEFVVQNEEREDIWRSQLRIDQDIGYKSFSLPKTAKPLETGQWYRWYVKVYCQSRTASAQYVQSWVKRIPLTSKLYLELQEKSEPSHKTYGSHGIWYDAVDRLLQEYQRRPSSLTLEQDWQNLIKAKGVELQALPNVEGSYEAVK